MTAPLRPEFEIVEFEPASMQRFLTSYDQTHIPTALGLIVGRGGDLLTFDKKSAYPGEFKRAHLPEATVRFQRDIPAVEHAIPLRFGLGVHGQILGKRALVAARISPRQTPRVFVPVIHTGMDDLVLDASYEGEVRPQKVWRSPEEVLRVLESDDLFNGKHGSQRRAITRTVVLEFLNS